MSRRQPFPLPIPLFGRGRRQAGALAYEESGAGPPVVLVHGLSGSTRWWERNVPALARQFHVYVVDLAGFGKSRGQPFVLAEGARALTRWMDALGIGRASFVGHSMGGHIVADLAADFPERVERLVLVDAAALPLDLRAWLPSGATVRGLRYLPYDFLPILVTDFLRAGARTIAGAFLSLTRADIRVKLSRIAAPTLIVWGEHDLLVPASFGAALVKEIPGARLEVLPNASHNPMWERAQEFNALVSAFLAEGQPHG
jgi:pimeloyl-ACP methyl ester carboxylesterase